jgi:hypothetical protein
MALKRLNYSSETTPLGKIFGKFLNAPDNHMNKGIQSKIYLDQIEANIGYNPTK